MKLLSWWMDAGIPTEKVAFVVLASDKTPPLHNRRTACCREEDLLRWAFFGQRKYPLALRLTDFDVEREKKQQRLEKPKKPSLSLARNRTMRKREWRVLVLFGLWNSWNRKMQQFVWTVRKEMQRSFDDRILTLVSFHAPKTDRWFFTDYWKQLPFEYFIEFMKKLTGYLETAWYAWPHDMWNRVGLGR